MTDLKFSPEQRLELAKAWRAKGYNCAQTLILAFPDVTGLSDDQAIGLSAVLGGGATVGELCGVASAMAVVLGMALGGDPADKPRHYAEARELIMKFAGNNNGCLRCRDLKGKPGAKTCDELIYEGVALLDERLRK